MGDESDKLVTIDVDPASKSYGKVINYVSVGGRGEAHHMGFTDDRKYIWAGRLDDNKIFVFDVGTDPSKPKLVNTIIDFDKKTGFVGPHTFYALPGRVLVGGLSNSQDHGGETGMGGAATATLANSFRIPSARAMNVPMNAATMPMTIVSQIGMGCLPGTTSRPSAPTMAPTMIAVMMPVTVTVSSSTAPGAADDDPLRLSARSVGRASARHRNVIHR